ncbi:hypothetical protein ID866_7345 [Astraeus odoratus]|nr:hypothetical protein ID866_7345 [Astraeus odoratus]
MFPSKSLFTCILLALSSVNASPAHLGVTFAHAPDPKRVYSPSNIQLGKRDDTVFVEKDPVGYYCAYIVTSSTTTFKVNVDSASAYTWVGAQEHNPYVQGPDSVATGVATSARYGGNRITFDGEVYNDTIGLGAFIIDRMGIGIASEVKGLPTGIDGFLGLGPARLNAGIRSSARVTIPTVVDTLYGQGSISAPLLGVYFTPENVGRSGLLSFGHIRDSVLASSVSYVPVTSVSPASRYWGIDASIIYGGNLPILRFGSGILDTGSAAIMLPRDAFQTYMWATRGILHGQSGLVYIDQARYERLQPLSIAVGDQTYNLSPNAQIFPRSSPNSGIWLAFQGMSSSSNIAFILGIPFLYVFINVLLIFTNLMLHVHAVNVIMLSLTQPPMKLASLDTSTLTPHPTSTEIYPRIAMFPSKFQFISIVLALSSVDASPGHLGITKMPFVPPPDSKHEYALYNNQFEKRDDTVFIERDPVGYYCAYLVTSSTNKVAIDTGSAYTWVGAQEHNPYVQGPASVATGVTTKANYADDIITFEGEIYNDTIGLGAFIIDRQPIGVPTELKNFQAGIDVVDTLYSQGSISSPVVGVYLTPRNDGGSGLLSFGHIHDSVLTGPVSYVPATGTYPASRYWGIDASITYANHFPILDLGPGTLDTGSPTITIPSDGFQEYKWVTGGYLHTDGLLYITEALYQGLHLLSIIIGDQSYDLSANAQILPRTSPDSPIRLIIQCSAPSDPTFTLGMPFFQRYYVVFNSTNNEIGFASHTYTDSTTN